MTDIVDRLRLLGRPKDWHTPGRAMNAWVSTYEAQAVGKAAADEIERLRAENALLRERNRQAIRAAMGAYERHVSTAPEQEDDR